MASRGHLHTKVCMKFALELLILPQTIMNMEISGGLSTELKQRIKGTKVAVIGNIAVDLISEAIRRLGFEDIVVLSDCSKPTLCDIAISTCAEKEACREMITHCHNISVPVICAFNFGIGGCVTVVMPEKRLPHFVEAKADDDTVKAMLDYTSGYSRFWNISGNRWVDYAMKWIVSPEISSSVGEYTMTAMTAHLLVAIIARNKIKTYPKFYLSTIVKDVN